MNQEPYQFKTQKKKKKDRKLLLLLLIPLLLLLGFGVLMILDRYDVLAEGRTDMSERNRENGLFQREKDDSFTEIIGHSKLEINKDNPVIHLENLSTNRTGLLYEVKSEDKTLFQSKVLMPGESEDFNALKAVPEGESVLKYLISVYDVNDKSLIHSGIVMNQEVCVKGE